MQVSRPPGATGRPFFSPVATPAGSAYDERMNPPRTPRSRRVPPRLALTPILVLGLACGGGAGADHETARAEIEEVTRRWERSLVEGDPAGAVADVFTEDAIRLPAGEPPVRGRAAISRALAGSVALTEARFEIEEVEIEGALAFATGRYAVTAPDGQSFGGKFLEVWRHTADGWRIHRVMWD